MDFAYWWNDHFTNVKNFPDSIEIIKLSTFFIWQIWKARNSKSFNGEVVDTKNIVDKVLFDFHEYESNLFLHFPL